MREDRPYGSEGGVGDADPYPYQPSGLVLLRVPPGIIEDELDNHSSRLGNAAT
jgi:hypothetical protein